MTLADENKIEAVWRLSTRMAPSQKNLEEIGRMRHEAGLGVCGGVRWSKSNMGSGRRAKASDHCNFDFE